MKHRSAAVALLVAVGLVTAPATQPLPQDPGAAGTWQKLLKLQTTASVMHTTAHPDDEHGGLLGVAEPRDGARVSLMTLNRGESGDNAIGPRAVRRPRPDSHRGAARRRTVLRRSTRSTSPGDRLRLLEAARRGAREVGQGERCCATWSRIIRTERPLVLVVALPGEPARRPRQPSDRRPDHAGRLQGRRRSERSSPSRLPKASGRGSR